MRFKSSAALGLVMVGTLAVAACGSKSTAAVSSSASSLTSAVASAAGGGSSSAAPSSSAASSAAASSPASSGASASVPAGGGGTVSGKVGVILPDTKSSARWETQDKPTLEAAFKAAGVDAIIQNAQGDAGQMTTIADQMITQGVKVLAIVNLDNNSGAAIEANAKSKGVKTLDYDRLTLGGSAEAYISYDNEKVGELQGAGLAKCLGSGDKNIVYLNGSPDDSNATAFAAGAHKVLDPMTNYKVVAEQAVPKWDNQQAATIFHRHQDRRQDRRRAGCQ
jgi:D-xylose transport system substrate-binding protein